MKTSAGIGEYLKRAFLYRWNLLFFIGGAVAAAISPWPDAMIPLLLAAEAAYLGGLVSIPKFRDAIDAQVHKEVPAAGNESLVDVVNSLTPESRKRFDQLRSRCLEMKSIARGVSGQAASTTEDLSTPALDRLLWIFLRLLVSQQWLERFLHSTNGSEIRTRIEEAKTRLTSVTDERIKHSLQDSVAAQELRLENYKKAGDNAEFVRLELDRIEAKIQALVESSVNRQDPDALSSQIEGVAASVQSTEAAIRELQQITGAVDQMKEPPAILDADWRKVAQ
ncbi:MAG: hypothetical protein ABSF22_06285 [Bryobacteraceae bacterium]